MNSFDVKQPLLLILVFVLNDSMYMLNMLEPVPKIYICIRCGMKEKLNSLKEIKNNFININPKSIG